MDIVTVDIPDNYECWIMRSLLTDAEYNVQCQLRTGRVACNQKEHKSWAAEALGNSYPTSILGYLTAKMGCNAWPVGFQSDLDLCCFFSISLFFGFRQGGFTWCQCSPGSIFCFHFYRG